MFSDHKKRERERENDKYIEIRETFIYVCKCMLLVVCLEKS